MPTKNKELYSLKGKRIWVAGHSGMVGSATVRRLGKEDCEILSTNRTNLDLRDQASVNDWLKKNQPNVVVVAAATVGGILANLTRPAEFLYNNLVIETNIINGSYLAGVEKLLFLGSACIYPRDANQPMCEDALLTGPLEPTNQWYAIAKIAGIKLCEAFRIQYGCDFISAQPNNLYGVGDNFDPLTSHVIPALIVKTHYAKTNNHEVVEIWGTGKPMREFLYVDDLADSLVHLLKYYSDISHINIGTGKEISILELSRLIANVVGFSGKIVFDESKPDGTPRKLLDSRRISDLKWKPSINLNFGIKTTYKWYLENVAEAT